MFPPLNQILLLRVDPFFLTYETELVQYLTVLENCLVHELRQLTRDTKSDFSCLQTMLTRRNENILMTFGVSRHIMVKEIIYKNVMKTSNNKKIINHRCPMQSEKSQPSGQRIMQKTRKTSFPALSVCPRIQDQ